jgi:MarR family transcriptional regulator, lower aerobic nicotinate degradation pathway regulator
MTAAEDQPPEYDPPARLRELPSWLTAELARRARRLVGEALAEEGARRQHFSVLTSLAEQGAASQADLGRRLWIDRSDLHAILAELEQQGAIERIRDARDRRRNVVTLTAAGAAAQARLDERAEAAQSALLAPLSAAERREFRRLLERLVVPGGE